MKETYEGGQELLDDIGNVSIMKLNLPDAHSVSGAVTSNFRGNYARS